MNTPLISAAELADNVGVHPSTVRRLAREGRIPTYWVGSTPRFDLDEARASMRREARSHRQTERPPVQAAARTASVPARPVANLRRLKAELYG